MNEDVVEEVNKLPEAELPKNFEEAVPIFTKKDNYSPEDMAAAFFSMQAPRLEALLSQMTAKQMRRVVFNACAYPFVDKKYSPRTQEEKTVAYLVHEMMTNKTIMQLSFEMAKAEKQMLKEQEIANNNPVEVKE